MRSPHRPETVEIPRCVFAWVTVDLLLQSVSLVLSGQKHPVQIGRGCELGRIRKGATTHLQVLTMQLDKAPVMNDEKPLSLCV